MNNPPVIKQKSKTIVRGSLLSLVLCSLALVQPALASKNPRNGGVSVPQIQWQACGDDFPGAECSTVQLPLDYDQPRGAKTTIALARIPASDQANKIGTIFVNPGGPGGSGTDLVLFGFGDFLNQTLLGRFDVVGWDPRGVGGSTPIQCWDSNAARAEYFADSPAFPYQANQERAYYERNRGIAQLCFSRNQPILRNMSTADVVRDLDLLRRAVGDEKLTYLGYSYGSHIGNTYANMYPGNVRALVIDGVLNPIYWTSGWQIIADRKASFDVLKEFFRLCDAAASDCALSGAQGSAARFEALREFVRNEPIILSDGQDEFLYTYDFFVADSAGVMYSPEIWPLYADFLDQLSDAVIGEPTAAANAMQKRREIERLVKAANPTREIYNNGTEAYLGNHCSDAEYPSSFALFSAIGKYAEAGSFQGPYWWWSNSGCAAWPTSSDRYSGPWVTRTSSPVLVVGNYFDPATDYAGAVVSSKLLVNSRLLSYAGWGHTAAYSGRSACVDDYVSLYLLDGSLPPKSEVCPASVNPFASPAATARAANAVPVMPMVGLPDLQEMVEKK